ncbi:TonB-dependent receptor (plasmid) [Novosphingobium sp. BL-8A]|uniref:TonB-dependent receptor domain-containing protein n=1 Tax=Novosphingobium sp. BL-8A TaxID=3127639 RepID=UPI0037576E08
MRKLVIAAALPLVVAHAAQAAEQDDSATVRSERRAAVSGQEIVVTATRGEQEIAQAPASMSVVTGPDLRRRPVQDLAEALENEPGVTINGVGMTRRGISIRGMSNEHVLTLVDGRRITDSAANMAHVDFDLGWVPTIAIDRIEVVRGPLSALYGSEALAGVVNVITRRPEQRLEASALALQGFRDGAGGDTSQLSALVGGPIVEDELGIVAWGEYRRRGRTASEVDPLQSELEAREALSGSVIAWWKPAPGHRIEIGQAVSDDDRARDTVTATTPPVYYEYQDHITRAQTHGSYTGSFDWGEVQTRAYRSVLERRNERDQGQTPTQPTRGVDFVADARVTVHAFTGNRLTLGAEHRNEFLRDSTINTAGEDSVNQDALFVQDEWNFGEIGSLTVGSRFDHHPAYGWQSSPRAYLVVTPVKGLVLRGGAGKAFKAPSLKQLSLDYITVAAGGRFIITGNPDLKPETNTAYELGAAYYGHGWHLGATLFQNDLRGLVQTVCVESCGIRGRERRAYVNVDKARIRGVELGGAWTPVESLSLSASYTYVNPQDISNDQELAERPSHSAKWQAAWDFLSGSTLSLRGRYIGKQTIYQSTVPVRLDGYDLWSAAVSHALNGRLTLKAGIDNMFKKRLAETSALYTYAEPGRVFFVGLGAQF